MSLATNRGSFPRRVAVGLTATSLAVSLLLTASGIALARGAKVTVCQYDETLGTFHEARVGPGGKPNKGLYLPDTALDGRTIYAIAYTNADGVAGYSAEGCDVFLSAVVENSGDAVPGAGDLVLFGRRPTSFGPPYGYAAIATPSMNVSAISRCSSLGVSAAGAPGSGGVQWSTSPTGEHVISNIVGAGFAEDDWIDMTSDFQDAVGTAASGSVIEQRWDPADNAFLDVDITVDCA